LDIEYNFMSKSDPGRIQKKSLDSSPDETRSFEKGKVVVAKVGNTSIGLGYFEPGWSWEKCVKPIVKTDSCQVSHTLYVLSGKVKFRMDDGSEEEYGLGDIGYVPPGHNAWVVGDEQFSALDITGAETYSKQFQS
jgi:hypothetical protein